MSETSAIAPIAAAIFGVLLHLSVFKHGEWHVHGLLILYVYLGVAILGAGVAHFWYRDLYIAITSVLSVIGSHILGLFTSIAIYRDQFHRLSNFPGPRLARVTKWYHVARCWDSRNFRVLEELREQYGDFVRTGMSICMTQRVRKIDLSNRASRTHYIPSFRIKRCQQYDALRPQRVV